MYVYYKFGLVLIFWLGVSISHTAPTDNKSSRSNSKSPLNDYHDYDEYSEEARTNEPDDEAEPYIPENRQLTETSTTTTTTTYRPIFSIPRRSSHVLEPSCPRDCLCLEDFKYVQCSNGHLTHVPLDLPITAAIIDLSHNDIVELRADDFSNLAKLVEINLSHNLIKTLDKDAFNGLKRLLRLRLANNQLTKIEPDTFAGATDLELLDLSNNNIAQRTDGSFLNQPRLTDFNCSNCSWTGLPDQIFMNMTALQVLRLDHNEFKRQINTLAFTPLKNLIKLKLPELDQENIEELCNLLTFIDNISFKHFDISCFEFVLGTSYNDSLIYATDSPLRRVTSLPTTPRPATVTPPRSAGNRNRNKITNQTTTLAKAGIMTNNVDLVVNQTKKEGEEEPYKVPISQETINTLLICIIVLAVAGIVVGLIFRKDVGGIKTKCCRTNKPEPKDQVHPTEEIPLNKLA